MNVVDPDQPRTQGDWVEIARRASVQDLARHELALASMYQVLVDLAAQGVTEANAAALMAGVQQAYETVVAETASRGRAPLFGLATLQ